jgi:hypothetical protein
MSAEVLQHAKNSVFATTMEKTRRNECLWGDKRHRLGRQSFTAFHAEYPRGKPFLSLKVNL